MSGGKAVATTSYLLKYNYKLYQLGGEVDRALSLPLVVCCMTPWLHEAHRDAYTADSAQDVDGFKYPTTLWLISLVLPVR